VQAVLEDGVLWIPKRWESPGIIGDGMVPLDPSDPEYDEWFEEATGVPAAWAEVASGWDEASHPRDPGGEDGGQFITKGEGAAEETWFHPDPPLDHAIKRWTGSHEDVQWLRDNPDSFEAEALRKAVLEAPQANRPLYRGMYATDMDQLELLASFEVGDVIPNKLASSFSESPTWVDQMFLGPPLDPDEEPIYPGEKLKWTGVRMTLVNGRALNVTDLGDTPWEKEWLVGRDMRVIRKKQAGADAWVIDVETI
jgi:hypothetical protein